MNNKETKLKRKAEKPEEESDDGDPGATSLESEMAKQEKKTMLEKLKEASPYNIFYNKIPALPETEKEPHSISFKDLLCPSLGKLKSSLQICSRVDIAWLVKQYEEMGVGSKPLTILYGDENLKMKSYVDRYLPNVTLHCVAVNAFDRYGSHRSKIGIYLYDDNSLRVVISTVNLCQQQWELHNHGIWVSPPCRCLPSKSSSGESPTNFKSSLIAYLKQYKLSSILDPWIDHVQCADFSDVKVFLVTTVPGHHRPSEPRSHLQQIQRILKQHCALPTDKGEDLQWPVIAQVSFLGSLGYSPETWLLTTFLQTVACHRRSVVERAPLKIVFPSKKNVNEGHFETDVSGGDGLRYDTKIHEKQNWLENYLYQWKADNTGRTKIMPDTKTYCRISPCSSKMAWFLLTTCNLSRGPWGCEDTRHGGNKIYVRNWETGVMFLPKFFGEKYFKVKSETHDYVDETVFPLIYDLPLVKYKRKDEPWSVAS